MSGQTIVEALENAVSGYPMLEGRFPQVSGISFVFDPKLPPFSRVCAELVQVADEWLDVEQMYSLCIKSYMYSGCDGFTMFKNCKVIVSHDQMILKPKKCPSSLQLGPIHTLSIGTFSKAMIDFSKLHKFFDV